jgi:4-hydroxy-3-polyprenylbenzoate decarboxylase
MAGLWADGWLRDARLLVLVDRDVAVHDLSRTFWKVLNSVSWTRDLVVADQSGDDGRPASGFPFSGKLGIDATRKLPGEVTGNGWPVEVRMDETIRELVGRRWREYGFRE